MSELIMYSILLGVVILFVIQFLCLNKIKSLSQVNNNKEVFGEALGKQNQEINSKFAEMRGELRNVSLENRTEINNVINNFQESLMKRLLENSESQNSSLDKFSKSLNELSEKLLKDSSEFKESVSSLFKESEQSNQSKQSDFVTKVNRHFVEFKDELKLFSEKQVTTTNELQKSLTQTIQTADQNTRNNHSEFTEKTSKNLLEFRQSINNDAKENRKELSEGLKLIESNFKTNITHFQEQLKDQFKELNEQQKALNTISNNSIRETKEATEKQLQAMREGNEKQLDAMRKTVDEKLQGTLEKRLGESFKQVSDRLEVVHKGLGEMQSLATGVGDLKKVLSNVKTRGILGEYQLGNILEQMLSPQQYASNVATKKGSQANVEYAIKLPGKSDDQEVWIPVDSKFPLEGYNRLLDAFDTSNTIEIESAQKELLKTIESFAKDISDKYIDPPHTTEFGIMFLPVEGLYAEVLRHPGLLEKLQRQYRITITGPTTLSAFLNSLQMGYKTLVIQKRSSEVWNILSAVKTEFGKFSDQLTKVHKQLNTATTSLDALKGTRLSVMNRKLQSVETMSSLEASEILELPASVESDSEK